MKKNWKELKLLQEQIEEAKNKLDSLSRHVLFEDGTEPPFHNELKKEKASGPGIYVDKISKAPLFSTFDQFDSGCGWPSFSKPLTDAMISTKSDFKIGYERTEIRSTTSNGHLGHVFNDGPYPLQNRYCINSVSLEFVSLSDLKNSPYKELYGEEWIEILSARETIYLAGGCFWGLEELLKKLPGVIETEVGYAGGTLINPSYEQVCEKNTGHAETVEVIFNPHFLSYELLFESFFKIHDPTTINQQGNDKGPQYRSTIFYTNEAQKLAASKAIKLFDEVGIWRPKKIVTEVIPYTNFFQAEAYHQDYLTKNPNGYSCHFWRA